MSNTWDIVTYGVVIAAAFAISQYRARGRFSNWVLMSSVLFLVLIFGGGYLLFLPFYLGFASQARGVAPNIFNRTPIYQFLIMWGMFVFVIASFIGVLFGQARDKRRTLIEWLEWAVPLLAVRSLSRSWVHSFSPSARRCENCWQERLQIDPANALSGVLSTFWDQFCGKPGHLSGAGDIDCRNCRVGAARTAQGRWRDSADRHCLCAAPCTRRIGSDIWCGISVHFATHLNRG